MHVLPLLLRRSDIEVNVTSRAQRKTTYDLAVSVTSKRGYSISSPQSQPPQPSSMSIMAFQASHGNGFIEQPDDQKKLVKQAGFNALSAAEDVRNKVSGLFRGSASSQTESSPSSATYQSFTATHDEQVLSFEKGKEGFMGAIGGAFGGLLNRRKNRGASFDETETNYRDHNIGSLGHRTGNHTSVQNSPVQSHEPIAFKRVVSAPVVDGIHRYSRHGLSDLPPIPHSPDRVSKVSQNSENKNIAVKHISQNGNEVDASSFHRVVSAPPGRIGVTFVQYRGHAMVSEVSPDSPLVGWIFRSDILIAIDDIAVSGLPVREIVKIISSKSASQRSLRVISSYALKDLTEQNKFQDDLVKTS